MIMMVHFKFHHHAQAVINAVVADEDPQLSTCLQSSDKSATGRHTITSPGNSSTLADTPTYPHCLYTQQQLERALRFLGPKLSEYGYSVPEACVPVLAGQAPGGTDASHVTFAPPDPRPPKALRHQN